VLQLASVLGRSFALIEIIGISAHLPSININDDGGKHKHATMVRDNLDIAVDEGILEYVTTCTNDHLEGMIQKPLSTLLDAGHEEKNDIEINRDAYYLFCHDTWRQKILSLLLNSYKQDIHKHAANVMETNILDIEDSSYQTKMKLFSHLKGSGDKIKAAELAIQIGKSFKRLGVNPQSVTLYESTLDMWRKKNEDDTNETSVSVQFSGVTLEAIESLEESDLTLIVKLLTALGQALGTMRKLKESSIAFENALEVSLIFHMYCSIFLNFEFNSCFFVLQIFSLCPVSIEIRDRSFLFPIYSGLFFLMKYGELVDPSEIVDYEHNLVSSFVEETRLTGNPVHYSRALAMQAEFFSRQGQYEDALFCHERLKRVYIVEKHSGLVVEAYATDRCAQNYGNASNCLYRLGRVEEALKVCDVILDELMPQMDLRNLHNSLIMIYPTLWIFKNQNMPERSLSALKKFVFEPRHEIWGDKGKTPCLCMFQPLEILFSMLMHERGELDTIDFNYIPWALEEDTFRDLKSIDNSMAGFSRCASSVGAEVCLLLSKHTADDQTARNQLVLKGWNLIQVAMATAQKCGNHQTTYFETKPVYDELSKLVKCMDGLNK
jgi:tetratricopeptide (TPR) repeat protein